MKIFIFLPLLFVFQSAFAVTRYISEVDIGVYSFSNSPMLERTIKSTVQFDSNGENCVFSTGAFNSACEVSREFPYEGVLYLENFSMEALMNSVEDKGWIFSSSVTHGNTHGLPIGSSNARDFVRTFLGIRAGYYKHIRFNVEYVMAAVGMSAGGYPDLKKLFVTIGYPKKVW